MSYGGGPGGGWNYGGPPRQQYNYSVPPPIHPQPGHWVQYQHSAYQPPPPGYSQPPPPVVAQAPPPQQPVQPVAEPRANAGGRLPVVSSPKPPDPAPAKPALGGLDISALLSKIQSISQQNVSAAAGQPTSTAPQPSYATTSSSYAAPSSQPTQPPLIPPLPEGKEESMESREATARALADRLGLTHGSYLLDALTSIINAKAAQEPQTTQTLGTRMTTTPGYHRPEPGSGLQPNLLEEVQRYRIQEAQSFQEQLKATNPPPPPVSVTAKVDPSAIVGSRSWEDSTRKFLEETSKKESTERSTSQHREAQAPPESAEKKRERELKELAEKRKLIKEKIELAEGQTQEQTKREELLVKNSNDLKKHYRQLLREVQRKGGREENDALLAENRNLQRQVDASLEETKKDLGRLRQTVSDLSAAMNDIIAAYDRLREPASGKASKRDAGKDDEKSSKRAKKSKHADTPSPKRKKAKKERDRSRSRTPPTKKAEKEKTETKKEPKKEEKKEDNQEPVFYQFYDGGSHFCIPCKESFRTIFDYLPHLHSTAHRDAAKTEKLPWMRAEECPGPEPGARIVTGKIRGVEMMTPSLAFYCQLCSTFSGDPVSAQTHLCSQLHGRNYQLFEELRREREFEAHVEKNPEYEGELMQKMVLGLQSRESPLNLPPKAEVQSPKVEPKAGPLLPTPPKVEEPSEEDLKFGRFDPNRKIASSDGLKIQIKVANQRAVLEPVSSRSSVFSPERLAPPIQPPGPQSPRSEKRSGTPERGRKEGKREGRLEPAEFESLEGLREYRRAQMYAQTDVPEPTSRTTRRPKAHFWV